MSFFKEIVFPPKDTRYVRGMPRFKTREEAERYKAWAEDKYGKNYIVVKNPSSSDFYYREQRKK